jgi:uncharacterized membrane protein SirB2
VNEWLPFIKLVHVASAALSIMGFIIRGGWMLAGSPRLRQRWVRIAPHAVDATLLGAGVWLMVATAQYPTAHLWLAVKLAAIVVYILLGMIAFRFGRTPLVRGVAFFAAITVFSYIVALAATRTVWPG